MPKRPLPAASTFLLLCLHAVRAADWPQFRGPNSDGHAGDARTPLNWSDTDNVAWKVAVPGLGWSSPVVVDGRLFLTTAVPQGEGLSLRTLAFNTESGDLSWDREIRALDEVPAVHQKNSHASPTPIVRDGSVFVHFGTHGTARLKADTGDIEWLTTELVYPPVHGSGGSPVLHDGKLFLVCDGSSSPFVVALNADDGKIAWKSVRGVEANISHSFVTPTVAIVNETAQVFAPGPNHFAAYDAKTGAELWRVLAPGWSVVPQPLVTDDLVVYNHDYDNPELIAIRLGGSGDVTESHIAWRVKRGAPSTPSPLRIGDELYCVDDRGIASCYDLKTGDIHWQERLGDNYSASPIHANGAILFLSEGGLATWVKPGTTFESLATNPLSARTFATPAFVDTAMYLRTDEHLYKIAE